MLDQTLARMPALSVPLGRHGNTDGAPGLFVQERVGREIVSIAARRGRIPDVIEAVRDRWGLTLPQVPRFVGDADLIFAWAGAGQWLAHGPGGAALEEQLRRSLNGIASITAQGDGRVILHVRGPVARTVLATGIPVDLHPSAFAAGQTAITLAGHIGVHLRQLDDTPAYELTAFRGFADDLCGWLLEAGAKHGVEVLARG